MAALLHWNYFLAVEDDLDQLSRYIEFTPANFATYSTELGRLLMAATQETDVLLQQICAKNGNTSTSEQGYREFIPRQYPNLVSRKVHLPRWDIETQPFVAWGTGTTPAWWTANNKVKHQRSTHYDRASLESAINACSALLLAAIHYYADQGLLDELCPAPRLLLAPDLVESITPTKMGFKVNFCV